jgi:hypothetical protein
MCLFPYVHASQLICRVRSKNKNKYFFSLFHFFVVFLFLLFSWIYFRHSPGLLFQWRAQTLNYSRGLVVVAAGDGGGGGGGPFSGIEIFFLFLFSFFKKLFPFFGIPPPESHTKKS